MKPVQSLKGCPKVEYRLGIAGLLAPTVGIESGYVLFSSKN